MLGPLRSVGLLVGLGWMLWGWAAEPARADDRWLVTEVEVGGVGAAIAAGRVADSLQQQGQPVLSGNQAVTEFERRHSRRAVQLTPSQVKQLDDDFRALADRLASDDLVAAQPLFRRLAELPPDSRDVLNRDPARARRAFQICLLSGHMLSRLGRDPEGLEQVITCAADYPGFQPEVGSYLPESIRKFFDRAFARLNAVPVASLRVSVPVAHAGRCCARVNGIAAQGMPATISGIRASDVRIQLDCGERPGRIHPLKLDPGANAIEIDPELDDAVTTTEQLGLSYTDVTQARERAIGHTVQLARILGADRSLLLLGDEVWRLDVASAREVAKGSVNEGPLDVLVARLVRGSAPERTREVATPESDSAQSGFPYRLLAFSSAGAAVVGAGVAVAGYVMRESVMKEHNDDYECVLSKPPPDRCDALLQQAADRRGVIIAGAIAAGSFAALSVVLFVLDGKTPDRAEVTALDRVARDQVTSVWRAA